MDRRSRQALSTRALAAALLALPALALLAPAAALADTGPATAPAAPPPLDGNSYDYDYDGGGELGRPDRAWLGRSFVHSEAAKDPARPLPLLVFLHGLNPERIEHRWMGGGREGDIRRITADMIEGEQIPPIIVAAPSTIDPVTASNAALIWPSFDLDDFIGRTAERLAGLVTIDRSRIIVAGHSGAGCNSKGGLTTALASKNGVFAGLFIDTCLRADLARSLAHAPATTHLVVTWQSLTWADRGFDDFRAVFTREAKASPAAPGILRALVHEQPTVPSPHDAMVEIALRRWLPVILPGAAAVAADDPAPGAAADE